VLAAYVAFVVTILLGVFWSGQHGVLSLAAFRPPGFFIAWLVVSPSPPWGRSRN